MSNVILPPKNEITLITIRELNKEFQQSLDIKEILNDGSSKILSNLIHLR